MSSTLQELGIGTYQNVAMVSEHWSCVSVIMDCMHSFFMFGAQSRPRIHVSRQEEKPQHKN